MTKFTMAQARALAEALGAEPDLIASNGVDGTVSFSIPHFDKDETLLCISAAAQGIAFDRDSIQVVQTKLEDSDIPVSVVTITTKEK